MKASLAETDFTVVINCGYVDQTAREEQSLAHQLLGIHSHNRSLAATSPCHVIAWDCSDEVSRRLLGKNSHRWLGFSMFDREAVSGLQTGTCPLPAAAGASEEASVGGSRLGWCPAVARDPSKVIVLSPDSLNLLDSIEDDAVIVVGGIVDRTITRMQSLATAEELGYRHARLPVTESITSESGTRLIKSVVLNVDTAAKCAMQWRVDHDWRSVLDQFVSKRVRERSATSRKADNE
jgi:hypothetical protein